MEQLLRGTTAYKILSGDRVQNRLSHAYMLYFPDSANLRAALKLFACEFFGADESLKRRIAAGSFQDAKIYPEEGQKIAVDGISEIIDDSALRPVEGDKKLYIIVGFEQASALVQNKLLKTLEEPLQGIHFLLGATALSPVLDTVKSRVKTLEIPPFSERQIFEALERAGHSELNAPAARSANGILGVAQGMVSGGWYGEVADAAEKICAVTSLGEIGEISARYADFKHKTELLGEMQRLFFTALKGGGGAAKKLCRPALIYAVEKLADANAEMKFNAYFQGLLYSFLSGVVKENGKWQKLQG